MTPIVNLYPWTDNCIHVISANGDYNFMMDQTRAGTYWTGGCRRDGPQAIYPTGGETYYLETSQTPIAHTPIELGITSDGRVFHRKSAPIHPTHPPRVEM